jgi:cytochrome c-type biogenesis protein CcmH
LTVAWAEWGPPLAVLAVGLVLGGWLVFGGSRTRSEKQAIEAEGRRADLEARHAATVQALRALDLERDKLDEAAYEAERRALVRRGADALRELDALPAGTAGAMVDASPGADGPPPELSPAALAALNAERERLGDDAWRSALANLAGAPVARSSTPSGSSLSPTWQGAVSMLAVIALAGGLFWLAGGDAYLRPEGGVATGGGPTPESARIAELAARVEANPKDVGALNELTLLALSERDAARAMDWNTRALEVDPKDLDARTYRAVLAGLMGMNDRSLAGLDEVLAEKPDHAAALVYKGMIALEAGKPDVAVDAIEKALAAGAPDAPFLQQMLDRAKSAQAGADAEGGATHGGEAQVIVAGTITLSPGASGAAVGAKNLFVSIRDPAGGPPLAALKLDPGPFPMAFRVTTADRIAMGGPRPMPTLVDISARLDMDGNAATRADTEPQRLIAGVATGADGLQIELR